MPNPHLGFYDEKPKIAIPMHYGAIVGTEKDAEDFKKLYGGCLRLTQTASSREPLLSASHPAA
jgi:L-ascorbate metabolism protein UlaG (beta-lactamase superfamily)